MCARAILTVLLLTSLVGLSGCGPAKLDETMKITVDSGGNPGRIFELDPQPKPQTITLEFESSTTEVTVALFNASATVFAERIDLSKAIKGERGKSGKFTVDVPANTETKVVVGEASKSTEVKLHMTNR